MMVLLSYFTFSTNKQAFHNLKSFKWLSTIPASVYWHCWEKLKQPARYSSNVILFRLIHSNFHRILELEETMSAIQATLSSGQDPTLKLSPVDSHLASTCTYPGNQLHYQFFTQNLFFCYLSSLFCLLHRTQNRSWSLWYNIPSSCVECVIVPSTLSDLKTNCAQLFKFSDHPASSFPKMFQLLPETLSPF